MHLTIGKKKRNEELKKELKIRAIKMTSLHVKNMSFISNILRSGFSVQKRHIGRNEVSKPD